MSKPITKIVQFLPSTLLGGGEMLAAQLSVELKRLNSELDVHVVSLYDPFLSPVYNHLKKSGVVFHSLGKKNGFDFSLIFKIRRLLKKLKPDIIHTHLGAFRYVSIACLYLTGFKKIHTIHTIADHDVTIKPYWYSRFVFRKLQWSAVSLNQSVQQSLNAMGIDSSIVPNGVSLDVDVLNCDKINARESLGLPIHSNVILSVGRFSEEKDQILLIDAFEQIAVQLNNPQLILVGSIERNYEYAEKVKKRISSMSRDMQLMIFLKGEVSNVPLWLKAADLFVLSSRWEGMPLVLMESMGYGLPIISTDAGGIVDMLEDEKDAVLVPTGSIEDLSNAIGCFFSEEEAIKNRRIESSLQKFANNYSIQSSALLYLNLYKTA